MYFHNTNEDFVSQENFEKAYQIIRNSLTIGRIPEQDKCTIILGGQPGAGKSTFYRMREDLEQYIAINGDEFRRFHPNYVAIAQSDPEHYAERTQAFSNQVVERLIRDLGSCGYNLIIEGTLRDPNVPISTCELLKSHGYSAELVVVACDAEEAWKSTITRAERQKENNLTPRLVPIDIYNKTVHQVADSLRTIEERQCFDSITVINRNGRILYDREHNVQKASEILRSELNLSNWDAKYKEYEQSFIQAKIAILQSKLKETLEKDDGLER